MPQLKQPRSLEEACIRLQINTCCDKCREWLQDMSEARDRDEAACKDVFGSVMEECRQMKEEISKLPPGILKLLSPRLANEFVELIRRHDCYFYCFPHDSLVLRRHYSVYKAMFRSVLTRFIEKFDMSSGQSEILSVTMLQNLDSVPGLLELSLNPWSTDQAVLLEGMKHVKKLQIFKLPSECTDEIIEQLQLHCPHLTVVDIALSRQVTNASVEHLRKVRKLRFLNVCGTSIDDEHYGLLLSESPNIRNITFEWSVLSLLRHIAVERLDTITHVRIVDDIHRNIGDLSGLTVFNALRALEFRLPDYGSSNIKTVLQGLGHRLTDLTLDNCDVDLQDIIILCPSLVNLSLTCCSFLNLNSGIPFDFQLPHFRNLINLEICNALRNPDYINYIRYYNSLKTIRLKSTDGFTVDLVNEIINLGTYKQLEVLRIWEDPTDVEALKLLIGHCPLLKRIEVRRFGNLQSDVFGELKRQVLLQNFDLKIKDTTTYRSSKYTVE